MNGEIIIYTKSGNCYKPKGNRTLQHTARIVSGEKKFIPCKDGNGFDVYLNTDEIERVTRRTSKWNNV